MCTQFFVNTIQALCTNGKVGELSLVYNAVASSKPGHAIFFLDDTNNCKFETTIEFVKKTSGRVVG